MQTALLILGVIIGLAVVVAVVVHAVTRKPDPLEDQDYRDEL